MGATAIFGSKDPFSYYRVTIQLADKFVGGVPKDPDVVRKWIESRINMGADLALNEIVQETIESMTVETTDADGNEVSTEPDFGDVIDAVVEESKGGNGFKRRADGVLVWEGRCAKAAVKEATNVAYPGLKWPEKKTVDVRKGAMNALAERFFVLDLEIPILVWRDGEWVPCTEPSGTEQRVKRVKTPQGERSAISVVDYIERPRLVFHLGILDDFLSNAMNGRIWEILQHIGVGADRGRSDGTFELVDYEKLKERPEVTSPYRLGGPFSS